jgi:hypothetical protein
METVQREGLSLFRCSSFCSTLNVSSAYHHIDMAPEASPYLGFVWDGTFYCFHVLPLGLSSAPSLFTTVMGHLVLFPAIAGKRPDGGTSMI